MREIEEINHAMMIMASKATKSARIPEASVPKNGKKSERHKIENSKMPIKLGRVFKTAPHNFASPLIDGTISNHLDLL